MASGTHFERPETKLRHRCGGSAAKLALNESRMESPFSTLCETLAKASGSRSRSHATNIPASR